MPCATGTLNCDGVPTNGCETNLNASATCGTSCSNKVACTGSDVCNRGVCGAPISPPSCQGLAETCGAAANEDCCTTLPVTGGTFYRAYDGVTYTDQTHPATVGSFNFDRFEVTVGRFRNFVAAWIGGYRPATGAGKHVHLNGGKGLAATAGGYEGGWDPTWATDIATTAAQWDTNFTGCYPTVRETWTSTPGSNETKPIVCVSWQEAIAFCTWDSGFLPSEAEWNYAASGGSEQRVYPWGSATADTTYANYCGTYCPSRATPVGTYSPIGNGKYGQTDLAGNAWEWTLDESAPLSATCTDCVNAAYVAYPVLKGGSYVLDDTKIFSSQRDSAQTIRTTLVGLRCARTP